MSLFILIILVIYLTGIKFYDFNQDYLSKEHTVNLRGMCCIFIVLHHILQRTDGGIILQLISYTGFLVLGMFYFFSGYGLAVQYQKKKQQYLQTFFSHRIAGIVSSYLLANIIYLIADCMQGKSFTLTELPAAICRGKIVTFSWFTISLLCLYLLFWCACMIAGNNKKHRIFIIVAGMIAYCVVCILSGLFQSWYVSVFPFVLGVVYPECKEKIETFFKKKYGGKLVLLAAASIILAMGSRVIEITPVVLVLSNAAVVLFCCVYLGICMKCSFQNRILKFVGIYSLEIYLYHGMILNLLKIKNDFLYAATGMLLSAAMAVVIKKIENFLFIKKK